MLSEILDWIRNLEPQIGAALINVIGVTFVGWFINRNITRLTAKYNEILARQTPTFELRIKETRNYIKLHYEFIQQYLNEFYYKPMEYITSDAFVFLDEPINLSQNKTLLNAIEKNEEEYAFLLFKKNFRASKRLVYSIYSSLIPDRLIYAIVLENQIFLKFRQDTPLIEREIQDISKQITDYVSSKNKSDELAKLIEEIKDPNLTEFQSYQKISMFWIEQQQKLYDLMNQMQIKFNEIWLNPQVKKPKKKQQN